MYPNTAEAPIDISQFKNLTGVIDAIYNPLRPTLVLDARAGGIKAEGGLYMLVMQAVRASEIFLDKKYGEDIGNKVYLDMMREKENIVLIGMPGAGKTTVGKSLARKYNREVIDTDDLIVKKANKSIPEIFKEDGEEAFRDLESEVIREVAKLTGVIIATGGGAILREENRKELKKNGRIYFIDRPLKALLPTEDRPLAKSAEAITERYNERYGIYTSAADEIINADCTAEEVAMKIKRSFG